jgi:hypothetical protein
MIRPAVPAALAAQVVREATAVPAALAAVGQEAPRDQAASEARGVLVELVAPVRLP